MVRLVAGRAPSAVGSIQPVRSLKDVNHGLAAVPGSPQSAHCD